MGAATMPSGAGWIRGLVVRGRGDFAAPSPTAEAFGLAARVVVAPATPEAVVLERVAAFLEAGVLSASETEDAAFVRGARGLGAAFGFAAASSEGPVSMFDGVLAMDLPPSD